MFKHIFLKKNRLSCNGCTKCEDVGNIVRPIIILKGYSVLQGSRHSCIQKISISTILHKLFILTIIIGGIGSLVYFLIRGY